MVPESLAFGMILHYLQSSIQAVLNLGELKLSITGFSCGIRERRGSRETGSLPEPLGVLVILSCPMCVATNENKGKKRP